MITLLYNTIEDVTGSMRTGRYENMYGATGVGAYPSKYAELVVYDPPDPSYEPTGQKIVAGDYYADVPNLLWTRDKTVVDMSAEEIAEYANMQKQLNFESAIQSGYAVPDSSMILSIRDDSRIMWNQLLNLLDVKLNNGLIESGALVSFLDISGNLQQMSASGTRQTIIDLGDYYYSLWLERNS